MNTATNAKHGDLLRALDGLTNWRAIVLLIGTGLLAAFLFGLGTATGSSVVIGVVGLLSALVWLFGICAAGVVLMDVARGLEPPAIITAFFVGAASFVKVLAISGMALLAIAVYWLVWALVFFLCKIPGLGVVLFAISFPVAIIVTALVTIGIMAALGLAFPAVWEGHSIMAAIARLVAIACKRPVEVIVNFLLLGVLVAFVSAVIFGILSVSLLQVGAVVAGVMDFHVMDLSSLFGGFSMGGGGSGYLTAAFFAGAVIFGVAAAAVFSVYLMGVNIIYLKLSDGLDSSSAEAMLSDGLAQAKKKAEEVHERAKQHAQQAQEQRQAAAATAAKKTCSACGATLTSVDTFCGECGQKVS